MGETLKKKIPHVSAEFLFDDWSMLSVSRMYGRNAKRAIRNKFFADYSSINVGLFSFWGKKIEEGFI